MGRIYEALRRAERERDHPGRHVDAGRDRPDEEYQRLRANILFTAGADIRTILIAAPGHKEGTSRVALGLARALTADQGADVLLIEANFRSPMLGKELSIPEHPGVAEYLRGGGEVDDLLVRVDSLSLTVLVAGNAHPEPNFRAMGLLLTQLAARFDYVLIDTPPVNHYADTCLLAPRADGVILVVAADQTPVSEAEMAKRSLEKAGTRILGVVLNRQRAYIPSLLQGLL